MAFRDETDSGAGFQFAELFRLLLVVLLWFGAVWMWAPAVGVELPDVNDVRQVVALVKSGGAGAPAQADEPPVATAGAVTVGSVAPAATTESATAAAPTSAPTATSAPAVLAPYCPPGKQPAFVLGFARLKERLGSVMGEPLECEHGDPNGTGDTLQQTSTGLAYYRKQSGAVMFTDGWKHWALIGEELVQWEGESPDPPNR